MGRKDVARKLRGARGFLFDLDGTLVLGDKKNNRLQALPGVPELLDLLAEQGRPFAALTNGTVRPPAEISQKLAEIGLRIPAGHILTPSTVAAQYFHRRGFRRILVLGVEGVWQPLADAGLDVVLSSDERAGAGRYDAVFIGWYRQIRMDEVEVACNAVWNGAGLYAASLVPFFASSHGRALGSSRAISAMITSITGKRATALGKPSPHALRSAADVLGCTPSELVVVGDDPALEVRMALKGGALAVGVHTGIAGAAEYAALPEKERPLLSLPNAGELAPYLRA
ncbi:MAG: HAD-IIA family hydrolase [Gammaproteobacteria bacterium]|nr:HAD-IIA family hydrolase [Gammaproteobacteria bacterium]MDH4255935.1 HAD-IIA family hydrolase [Gammaproteobacteria bacterium]MDH5311179.1 HAD-IIA family hydrolase [Gammaproteobacteria bacterium]